MVILKLWGNLCWVNGYCAFNGPDASMSMNSGDVDVFDVWGLCCNESYYHGNNESSGHGVH